MRPKNGSAMLAGMICGGERPGSLTLGPSPADVLTKAATATVGHDDEGSTGRAGEARPRFERIKSG